MRKRFSIILATYNRPVQLAECLRALARLDYPRAEFEVVVVDDGGAAPLDPVIDPFRASLDIQLIRQVNGGPASARNTGVAAATGACIAFTDDDCAPEPGWLTAFDRRLQESPGALFGGSVENGLVDNPQSTASQMLASYLYDYFEAYGGWNAFFTSNNMAMSRALFLKCGGFDSTFSQPASEDRELCDRWRHHGGELLYAPEAAIRHFHALTFRQFWRQHFVYGTGAYYFHITRSARTKGPLRLEPFRFYFGILRYPLRKGLTPRALHLSFLLGVTQAAHTLGYFYERSRDRGQSLRRYREAERQSQGRPSPSGSVD